jgi:hypothetical protein
MAEEQKTTTAGSGSATRRPVRRGGKKERRVVPFGRCHIQALERIQRIAQEHALCRTDRSAEHRARGDGCRSARGRRVGAGTWSWSRIGDSRVAASGHPGAFDFRQDAHPA